LTKIISGAQTSSEITTKVQSATPITNRQALTDTRPQSAKGRNGKRHSYINNRVEHFIANRNIIATSTIVSNEQHQNEYHDPDYNAFEEQLRSMNNRKGVKKMRQNSGNKKEIITAPTSFANFTNAEVGNTNCYAATHVYLLQENNTQIQQNNSVINTCVLIDDMSCSSTDHLQLRSMLATNMTPSKRRVDTLSIGQFGTDSRGLNSAIGNHLLSSPNLGPTSFAQHTLHTPPRPNR
jgi:hypothetical protein